MRSMSQYLLISMLLGLKMNAEALIPSSPQQQTRQAVQSIKKAIESQKDKGSGCRLFVDYLIPLPEETKPEDIDPWPGGLAQMYPYAETILKDILGQVVDEAGSCSSQVVNQADCCGFLVQESKTSPKNDVAAILFPGVDQLKNIEQINDMVGPRTLILFNKQFQRPTDFGFTDKDKAQNLIFDKLSYGYAFQEFACRGEDIKLVYDHPMWESYVVCDEDLEKGRQEIQLLEPQSTRPSYDTLEAKINQVLPEPLWMRKMGEAKDKGFKFQRGQ